MGKATQCETIIKQKEARAVVRVRIRRRIVRIRSPQTIDRTIIPVTTAFEHSPKLYRRNVCQFFDLFLMKIF